MIYDDVKKKNIEFFNKTIKEAKNEHYAVAQSETSHIKRFNKIYELGDWKGKSVLDIGCGLGGFYDFLIERGFDGKYKGYDINELMIKKAKQKHSKIEKNFSVKDIIDENINERFNYIISVGPLNLKFEKSTNMEITKMLLKRMYEIATDAFAISMTSSLTKKKNNDTFYYNPFEIGEYISCFTNNYIIDHSFLPHDFVLFVYKRDLYDF